MSEAADTGFSLILHYSPEMVAELALGADHPHEIAERYGVDAEDYEHLAAQDWFQRLVVQKRHEFHDTGVLFVAKAGMMAEALLTRLFQQSMANVLAAPLTVEVAKQLTEIGRLKPQPINTQPGAAGGAFQINIMVGDRDVTAASHTVTVPAPVEPTLDTPAMTLDFAKSPPADKTVSNLRAPDFDMRPGPPPAGLPGQPTSNAAAFGGPPVTSSVPHAGPGASPPAGPSRSLDPQPGASVGLPRR
jgi:hypothetical protein